MKEPALNLLNFQREDGQIVDPVALAFQIFAPVNAARGRDTDSLLAYLVFTGNSTSPDASEQDYKALIGDTFFQFQGPLTSALKATVEKVNQQLMDSNMRSTGKGEYRFGCLVLCAIQQQKVTVVQSGPSRAYKVGPEMKEFFDPTLAGKGLGISPSPKMYFAQTSFSATDKLIITLEQPKEWKVAIEETDPSGSDQFICENLLAATEDDVAGLVVSLLQQPTLISSVKTAYVEQAKEPLPELTSDNATQDQPKRPSSNRNHRDHPKHRPGLGSRPSIDWAKLATTLLAATKSIRGGAANFSENIENNLGHILPEGSPERL